MSKTRTQLNVGEKFNRLTAVKMLPRLPEHKGHVMWEFTCDCGTPVTVAASRVVSGRLKSCGCFQRDYQASLPRVKDIKGQKFGRWAVLEFVGKGHNRMATWKCRCDCGTERVIAGAMLRYGNSTSCGCYQKEAAAKHCRENYTTHGLTRTPTGVSWTAMMQRCHNPRTKAWPDYGERGIKPCAFIKASPANLISLIGERPSLDLTLDKIENKFGYFCGQCEECKQNGWPMNVRWATRKVQNNNRRFANMFSIDGVRKTISEWAEIWGVPYTTARYRIWHEQRLIDESMIDYTI